VNLEESPWAASNRSGRTTGGSGSVGARVTVAVRESAAPEHAARTRRSLIARRQASPATRRRRSLGRRSAWTASARGTAGWEPGSTSASEALDAGRRSICRPGATRCCRHILDLRPGNHLLGVRSCSLCRFGLELPHHLGTRPAAAPKRCITG